MKSLQCPSVGEVVLGNYVHPLPVQAATQPALSIGRSMKIPHQNQQEIVPISRAIELINAAARELKAHSPHPHGKSQVCFLARDIEGLTLYEARLAESNRSVFGDGDQELAKEELEIQKGLFDTIEPLKDDFRRGALPAETLFKTLASTDRPQKALQTLIAASLGHGNIHNDDHEFHISAGDGSTSTTADAAELLRVKLRPLNFSRTANTCTVAITEFLDGENSIWQKDLLKQQIELRNLDSSARHRLPLCIAFEVDLELEVAISVRFSMSRVTVFGTVVDFIDWDSVATKIRAIEVNEKFRLF
jgi:hypothetical protein